MKTTPEELDPGDPREENIRANLGMLINYLSELFPGNRISILVMRTPHFGKQSKVNLATDLDPHEVPFFLAEAVKYVTEATRDLRETAETLAAGKQRARKQS